MDSLTEHAGRNLKAELVRSGKTRADLAAAWGCSLSTVSHRLGGSASISIKDIEQAAPIFGMSSTQLLMRLLQPIDGINQIRP